MPIDEKQEKKIQRIFPDIGHRPLFKMAIRRVKPKHCAEYLCTLDVYDEEDASWENIRAQYGGGNFYIKILDGYGRYLTHRTLPISGDPMKNGKKLYERDEDKPYWREPVAHAPCECDTLREEIALLTDKLEKFEDRQERAVEITQKAVEITQKALELTEQEDDDTNERIVETIENGNEDRIRHSRLILASLGGIARAVAHIERLGGIVVMGLGIFALKTFDKE